MSSGEARSGRQRAGSGVSAALGALELLAGSAEPLSLGEIGRRLGVPKSTVARVMEELVECGYVTRHPSGRTYRADYGLITLGGELLQRLALRQRAGPHLHRLAARTGVNSFLGVLWRTHSVLLDRATPLLVYGIEQDIGQRYPMHAAAIGKAILAFLPDAEREARLSGYELRAITPTTITDPERFGEELRRVRARGYAATNEELGPGQRAVAAPVFDSEAYPVGAVALSGWDQRLMSEERYEQMLQELRDSAMGVSHAIGYGGPVTLDRPAPAPAGLLTRA